MGHQQQRGDGGGLMAKNNLKGFIANHLEELIDALEAQGYQKPSLRACYYYAVDEGLLIDTPTLYDSIDARVSVMRDSGEFPYGRISGDSSGVRYRGLLPDELAAWKKRVTESNVAPRLFRKRFPCIVVEKAGLVTYLRSATRGHVPVMSSEGQLRKEQAYAWATDIKALAERLGGEPIIYYLGDYDRYGSIIWETNSAWFMGKFGIVSVLCAVTKDQAKQIKRPHIHIDGFIAVVGPENFAKALRKIIGIPER